VICGTRGVPDTVAPFRAWRGSRDLVAQSPKFHSPAVAQLHVSADKSLAHQRERNHRAAALQFEMIFVISEPQRIFRLDPQAALRSDSPNSL